MRRTAEKYFRTRLSPFWDLRSYPQLCTLTLLRHPLRGSLAKRRWVRKGAPQSVGAGLSASIWWPFAVKLWCQSDVRPITKLSLRGCLRRVDVDDQGLLRRSQNGKVTAETLLHSLAKADSGGLLGRFRHPLRNCFAIGAKWSPQAFLRVH